MIRIGIVLQRCENLKSSTANRLLLLGGPPAAGWKGGKSRFMKVSIIVTGFGTAVPTMFIHKIMFNIVAWTSCYLLDND